MDNLVNIDIFILARMGSSRFPEKILSNIDGKPAIKFIHDRLKNIKEIRKIVVCTTDKKEDDKLVDFLKDENIEYFRGSEKDVLKRFLDAAHKFNTDIIIDVEGDKIFTDPIFVKKIVQEMLDSDIDFCTGSSSKIFFDTYFAIHGFMPAGIRVGALKKIVEMKKTKDTETGYKEFFTENDFIKSKYIVPDKINYPKNLRLFLDYEEDLKFAVEVIKRLNKNFDYNDVLRIVNENPELIKIVEPAVEKWKKNYLKKRTNYLLG